MTLKVALVVGGDQSSGIFTPTQPSLGFTERVLTSSEWQWGKMSC